MTQSQTTTDETAQAASASSGPGARLLEAREARNMAVSEVASLLCLDSSVVRAMEQDDVANLPSATFVKGYLRGYAKLVGLDGQSLVDEYAKFAGPSHSGLKVTDMAAEKTSLLSRWVFALMALVIVLSLAWYWSSPSEQPVSTDTLQSNESLAAQAEQSNDSSSEEREAVDDVVEKLLQGMKDEPAPATNPSPVSQAVTVAATVAESAVEAEKSQPSAAASKVTDAGTSQPAATLGLVNIRLVGSQTSWVSMRDDRQQRIFRNNLKTGASRELTGLPPIIVNFGNAAGVELYVDGKRFDHAAWHKANGTARFVINPAR